MRILPERRVHFYAVAARFHNANRCFQWENRLKITLHMVVYRFICVISASGFAVICTQAGRKPLLIAVRAERIFDQAQQ